MFRFIVCMATAVLCAMASISSAQLISNFSFTNVLRSDTLATTGINTTSLPVIASRSNNNGEYGVNANYNLTATNTSANFEIDCTISDGGDSVLHSSDSSGYPPFNPNGGISLTLTAPAYYSFSHTLDTGGGPAVNQLDTSVEQVVQGVNTYVFFDEVSNGNESGYLSPGDYVFGFDTYNEMTASGGSGILSSHVDIQLSATSIPEPTSTAIFVAAFGLLLIRKPAVSRG